MFSCHIDLWDLKPSAPEEIRGPFNPQRTIHDVDERPFMLSEGTPIEMLIG
jgi:hypothetical protein